MCVPKMCKHVYKIFTTSIFVNRPFFGWSFREKKLYSCFRHILFKQFVSINYELNSFFSSISVNHFPASIYLLKGNNRNTRARCEICSKLTIKTPEWRQKLTLKTPFSSVSIVNFEHVIADWINICVIR